MNINYNTLLYALSEKYKQEIISAEYKMVPLEGGGVGEVILISGNATTVSGEKLPYKLALKIQDKWERYGDPHSWRREYDFYRSDFETLFLETFRWPACYYASMNEEENEFELWMEYIEGLTGLELHSHIYEQAALELGRLQGRLYSEKQTVLDNLTNLSNVSLSKNTYFHYRSWPLVYNYIRSEDCDFPLHVRAMLIDFDDQADEILARIEKLPIVLCHRDFWVNNIIYADGKIRLIDWDTSGWGHMGEDIASLIADEADIDRMVEHYQRCVPAYYKGFLEYADVPPIANNCIYEMIILVFGYRLVEWYLHEEDEEKKNKHAQTLQKIYEIKNTPL